MPFDPYYTRLFDQLADLDLDRLDDPRIAAAVLELVEAKPEWSMPDVAVQDRLLPGRGADVPVRVYLPPGRVRSVLVWAHGGGFTGGDLDMRESHMVCAELAARAHCAVVAVGYRLAVGGVRFPIPLDDVHAAWRWAVEEWQGLAAIVGGASAGAALAMATAVRDRDSGDCRAAAMLVAYPLVHAEPPVASGYWADAIRDLPPPARLPPEYIAGIVRDYVGDGMDVPAEAFPGGSRMEGLPSTAIVVPEYDGLRAAGLLLEEQLRAAEVPVRSFIARGVLHGHLNLAPSLPGVQDSLEFMTEFVREVPTGIPQRVGGRP